MKFEILWSNSQMTGQVEPQAIKFSYERRQAVVVDLNTWTFDKLDMIRETGKKRIIMTSRQDKFFLWNSVWSLMRKWGVNENCKNDFSSLRFSWRCYWCCYWHWNWKHLTFSFRFMTASIASAPQQYSVFQENPDSHSTHSPMRVRILQEHTVEGWRTPHYS